MKRLLSLLLVLTLLTALTLPVRAEELLPEATPYTTTDVLLDVAPVEEGVWFEETYPDWYVSDWEAYEAEQAALRQAAIDARKVALGGTPGAFGVMVDGVYLTFPDAQPMAEDNVLIVPQDVLLPALGIDELPAELYGVGPFFRGGSVYVALRPIAEALGYTVWWDAQFETAVLLHRQTIVDDWNARTVILHDLIAAQRDRLDGQTVRSTVELSAAIKVFDTLDGNKDYKLSFNGVTLQSGTAGETTATLRLSDAKRLLAPYLTMLSAGGDDADTLALIEQALDLLREVTFSLRYDLEAGELYFNCPALSILLPVLGPEDWLLIDLPGAELLAAAEGFTIGDLLYSLFEGGYHEYYYATYYDTGVAETTPVFAHGGITGEGERLLALFEDAAFVRENNRDILRLDLDDINAYLDGASGDNLSAWLEPVFKEFSLTLSVRSDRTFDLNFRIRPQMGYSGLTVVDFLLAGDLRVYESSSYLTLDVHVKNRFQVTLTMSGSYTPSSSTPATVPPEGARVVELWELYQLGQEIYE